MRFSPVLLTLPLALAGKVQRYPESEAEIATFPAYKLGTTIPLDCTKRQIDTGEHYFDDKGNIVFTTFPKCQETRQPPTIKFGVNEQFKCTVSFQDTLYHLFQLYLHQDAPFTCRIPVRPESNAYVPLAVQVRGNVMESHFDLDPNLNLLLFTDADKNSVVSATSFSSSLNTTKVIIGDSVEFHFDVHWTALKQASVNEGVAEEERVLFYRLPENSERFWMAVSALSGAIVAFLVTVLLLTRRTNRKLRLQTSFNDKVE